MLIELVEVALGQNFRERIIPAATQHRISRRIAETIFEDRACHEALERFRTRPNALQL